MPRAKEFSLCRLLHAGYFIESGGSKVIFDPLVESIFSRNCQSFPRVEFDLKQVKELRLTAIFISHFHDDHFSLESLKHFDRNIPVYIFCIFEELIGLIEQLGFVSVKQMRIGDIFQFDGIRIEVLPALDVDVDSIFHIQAGDLNILNVVDSWIDYLTFEKLKKTNWDLILWPFQVMREYEVLSPSRYSHENLEWPPEWKEQLRELNPRAVVPSSCQFRFEDWSWYNRFYFLMSYGRFKAEIDSILPKAKVIRLDPGDRVVWRGHVPILETATLPWLYLKEDQEVDYSYDPHAGQDMALSFISRRLGPVSATEEAKVMDYLNGEKLSEDWKKLDHEREGYFYNVQPVLWRLKIFDSQGVDRSIDFKLQGLNLRKLGVPVVDIEVDWLTEIPLSRLIGAMFYGESLTSLYIRINDCQFDQEKEKALLETDLLEDPLLRLLYDGKIGSYQKAQLERILVNNSF